MRGIHRQYTPSLIFNVTSMSLRLIPRGKKRTYKGANELYELFLLLYKDIHPNVSFNIFIELLKEIFPVYKNPRKGTDEFKITIHDLDERLRTIGIKNFPISTMVDKEILKIEM